MSNFDLNILINIVKDASEEISSINNLQELEALRIKYLGDKSQIQAYQKNIINIEPASKKEYGQIVNQCYKDLNNIYNEGKIKIENIEINNKLNKEKIDISLSGIAINQSGSLHPLTIITKEICNIFHQMGFVQADSPEIETEYHNFTALNTPESHPARDSQDTFYTEIADHVILRSHVSPFQIRIMQSSNSQPIRAISSGRVYRNEEINPRKLPFFHQLEIICIDKDINFSHLKWTLQTFFEHFFGDKIDFRLRPDFFPFTEPSCEVDAKCPFCNGKGCSTCSQKGWIELLGCGMIDPNVLEESSIDTNIYSGFAAGLGIERFAMLKYGINDIRDFYSGDMRFLSQFV